jgi:hypothetical protein
MNKRLFIRISNVAHPISNNEVGDNCPDLQVGERNTKKKGLQPRRSIRVFK